MSSLTVFSGCCRGRRMARMLGRPPSTGFAGHFPRKRGKKVGTALLLPCSSDYTPAMTDLTHLDEHGAARMVDVSDKAASAREAVAEAVIVLSAEAFAAAMSGDAPKGDVLAAARIAGIMAAKKTSELIPLCHPIPLSKAGIEFEPLAERNAIRIVATAKTNAQTGVEMEALTAASIAALTIYDMVKAVDKSAEIESIRLLTKSGGKSGAYIPPHRARSARVSTPAPRPRTSVLAHETAPAKPRNDPNAQREAFRAFM